MIGAVANKSRSAGVSVLDDLAVDMDGTLLRPGEPGWDQARQAWHLDVDQHPAAVALVSTARDVVAVVDAARHAGLRVAAQSTGHNAGPLGDLAVTVLLRTGLMRDVEIDTVARVARVQAGAWWMDVTNAAAEHGLAALAGSSPDVGVAGYALGGGLSWLARSHGLAANSVLALEVVTADGVHRRVDAYHDADLFWALRGGGGSFGIVTTLELQLFPITDVYAGVLFFPFERATEVLQAWREWIPTVPESVTSVGRILKFPPLEELPPHLAGRSFVVIEAACQLDSRGGGPTIYSAARPWCGVRHVPADAGCRAVPIAHGPTRAGAGIRRRDAAAGPRRRPDRRFRRRIGGNRSGATLAGAAAIGRRRPTRLTHRRGSVGPGRRRRAIRRRNGADLRHRRRCRCCNHCRALPNGAVVHGSLLSEFRRGTQGR